MEAELVSWLNLKSHFNPVFAEGFVILSTCLSGLASKNKENISKGNIQKLVVIEIFRERYSGSTSNRNLLEEQSRPAIG